MRSINLSASSIKDFQICPKRYYFRINYPLEAIKTPAMNLGTVVHEVLEKFWNTNIETALSQAKKIIVRDKLEFNKKEYKKLQDSIKNYFTYYKHLTREDDIVEKYFKIPLQDNVYLVGRIDRLNIKSGIVIDWKTNERAGFSINDDVQFLVYQYAFNKVYHKEPKQVLYVNVYRNKLLTLDDYKDNLKELITVTMPDMIAKIKSGNLAKEGKDKLNVCKNCPFAKQCLEEEA